MTNRLGFFLSLTSVVFSASLSAQGLTPKMGANRLVSSVVDARDPTTRGRAFSELVLILQQHKADVPAATLDSIADALVSICLRQEKATVEGTKLTAEAIGLLARAAAPDARKPYSGSFSRLRYIYENATEVGVRGGALGAISRIADQQKSLDYLESVATSQQQNSAYTSAAVRHLLRMGEPGVQRVRLIDQKDLVKNPETKMWLMSLRSRGYVVTK